MLGKMSNSSTKESDRRYSRRKSSDDEHYSKSNDNNDFRNIYKDKKMSSSDIKQPLRSYGPWSEFLSSTGKVYYYNYKTEKTQWDKPPEWDWLIAAQEEKFKCYYNKGVKDYRSNHHHNNNNNNRYRKYHNDSPLNFKSRYSYENESKIYHSDYSHDYVPTNQIPSTYRSQYSQSPNDHKSFNSHNLDLHNHHTSNGNNSNNNHQMIPVQQQQQSHHESSSSSSGIPAPYYDMHSNGHLINNDYYNNSRLYNKEQEKSWMDPQRMLGSSSTSSKSRMYLNHGYNNSMAYDESMNPNINKPSSYNSNMPYSKHHHSSRFEPIDSNDKYYNSQLNSQISYNENIDYKDSGRYRHSSNQLPSSSSSNRRNSDLSNELYNNNNNYSRTSSRSSSSDSNSQSNYSYSKKSYKKFKRRDESSNNLVNSYNSKSSNYYNRYSPPNRHSLSHEKMIVDNDTNNYNNSINNSNNKNHEEFNENNTNNDNSLDTIPNQTSTSSSSTTMLSSNTNATNSTSTATSNENISTKEYIKNETNNLKLENENNNNNNIKNEPQNNTTDSENISETNTTKPAPPKQQGPILLSTVEDIQKFYKPELVAQIISSIGVNENLNWANQAYMKHFSCTNLSVDLKNLRSTVRIKEIKKALIEQRLSFLQTQMKEIDELLN